MACLSTFVFYVNLLSIIYFYRSLYSIYKMSECNRYDPDKVFQRFKLVDFPTSFVGLSITQNLELDVDLNKSAYFKTLYEGHLLKFEEAREVSASHRAFIIVQTDEHTIQITYHPKNESISKAKLKKQFDNRFVCDLRLIQVDEERCCHNELHAEIGRFYISGQYEYCQITHQPKIADFGDTFINTKVTVYVRMRNQSKCLAASIHYERLSGFDVVPNSFTIYPNSSIRLAISITPYSLKVPNTLLFRIKNPHHKFDAQLDKQKAKDVNYINYAITTKINISLNKPRKVLEVESLHKLYDRLPKYTYLNKELEVHNARKAIASKYLKSVYTSNYTKENKIVKEKFTTGNIICYSDPELLLNKIPGKDFCKVVEQKATIYDLIDIQFHPSVINFGNVALSTHGKEEITIKNGTQYNISVRLCPEECILYTENELTTAYLKLKPLTDYMVTIYCLGLVAGSYKGKFEYIIDNKYQLKHSYSLQVGNPVLLIMDESLKFGMVTTETFIRSAPLRIYNNFNNTINFKWADMQAETPFEIMPMSGSIPGRSCKICDVMYICTPTKTKTHEVELISESLTTETIPVELSVVTRKVSIKFLQQSVVFKDIPLNLETVEKVKLENTSRELVLFYVVEPLIPGLRIEPMCGTIRPKMLMTFNIIVKIPYVLEFNFDVYIKINNKEVIILPISGAVVEPKIVIQPKNIYMPRIPCYMITYLPVVFQNTSGLKTEVTVLDTGDDNIFNVYIANGNEKQRVYDFTVESGQSKTVFIKVFDIFRREYDMYIPFKINGLLGPPVESESTSTELQYYVGEYEQYYENNLKVKLKSINKDISYCRVMGVITVPWLTFSVDNFEFEYVPHGSNSIDFTITNVSKYYLYITIVVGKLAPHFSLNMRSEHEMNTNESQIKFELDREQEAELTVKFTPKGQGTFIATAILFLDINMTIPYSNLTFFGSRNAPAMTPSTYSVIFPPCYVGTKITQNIRINFEMESDLNAFSCISKDSSHISAKFVDYEVKEENCKMYTVITVELTLYSEIACTGNLKLIFNHENSSTCDVEVHYCVTYCPLTLHANNIVSPEDNPYPYYPLSTQTDLYKYMENCCEFLEKWMFQQGFRRELYPVIPDTFHVISSALSSQGGAKTGKMNVSYLNFIKRIAGPLMKYVRKVSVHGYDDSFKYIKEIHDTYRGIIRLLLSRGANLWVLQPEYLLSHEQFVIYVDHVTPKCNADIVLSRNLIMDVDLYDRLNKQSWIDFILQSYKVFIMDSCFFECVCVSDQPRNVINILIEWYNTVIASEHDTLLGQDISVKSIRNITTDLTDGIAFASAIIKYCPFLRNHFSIFCEIKDETREGDIINNACLIIDAMNLLKLFFPLCSKDFFEPNFLQMLFLSIHLYVVLPTFTPKDTIILNPPLLRSSTRNVSICPSSQESLIFSFITLNNNRNAFVVEKVTSSENGKKMFLSVRYIANFVDDEECLLLVHGYNKTRIFDTYIMFILNGKISTLNPQRKCKVTGPLYRPNKVDVTVASPFPTTMIFSVYITDVEPSTPVKFDDYSKPRFYVRRLNLIDKEICLSGVPNETGQDIQEHKLYLQLICLSTQVCNSWIWFTSEVGQFFIKVTTQPRWDLPIDTLQAKVHTWPMDPCSCGEACECYRTTALLLPHCNDLMLKALRYALVENVSPTMLNIYDQLIETKTGKIILSMLLEETGTNMSELEHMLRSKTKYRITSRTLLPRFDSVTLAQHTNATFMLPVTIPINDKVEKYTITMTSECGMDIRTYRIFFVESKDSYPDLTKVLSSKSKDLSRTD